MSEDQKASLFNLKKADTDAKQAISATGDDTSKSSESESSSPDSSLFSAKTSKDTGDQDSKILDSVVATEGSGKDEKQDFLKISQNKTLDTSEFIDQDYHLQKKLSFARGAFFLTLFVSLVLGGYFYTQLSPSFELLGMNTTQTLEDLDKKVIATQTDLNSLRYEIAKIYLDDFSFLSDQYSLIYRTFNSHPDTIARSKAESELITLQEKLGESFEEAKKKLLATNWTPFGEEEQTEDQYRIAYLGFLKDHFKQEQQLSMKSAASADRIKELQEVSKLIGNAKLISALKTNDFSEITYDHTMAVIDAVNSTVSNALSNVYKVKSNRVNWSAIISEIDEITTQEDISYKNGFFEQIGGIQYTSYQFDSKTGRVIVTGQTKNDEAKNFTVMANLIDKFEASPLFENVTMRTFSKAGTPLDGYTSTIKLELSLQKTSFDEEDVQSLINDAIETLSFGEDDEPVRRKNYKVQRKPFNAIIEGQDLLQILDEAVTDEAVTEDVVQEPVRVKPRK